jgi:hypothetical protein
VVNRLVPPGQPFSATKERFRVSRAYGCTRSDTLGFLPLLDVAIGIAVLAVIGVAAVRPTVKVSAELQMLGWFLVAVPLPAAIAIHLSVLHSGRLDQALFISALLAFALGAMLVLAGDSDDEGGRDDEPEPHWWPAFEQSLHDYTSTSQKERVHS